MKCYISILLLLFTMCTHATSKDEIIKSLDAQKHRCMSTGVHLSHKNEKPFSSLFYVECSYYNVLLTSNIYFDKGFDSNMANNILSHRHDRKTLSSLFKRPPSNSITKDYKKKSDAITINFINDRKFQKLMKYIYKERLPFSMSTTEYLKQLNGKNGMFIIQQVDVNFLNFDDAYKFLDLVTNNYFNRPISGLSITE